MNRLHSLLCLSSLAIFSFACAPQETEEEMLQRTAVDVRVPIPAPDPNFVDFVGSELIIKPGEDAMICTHQPFAGEDVAYDLADPQQGKFGHHFIIVKAKKPLPAGTVEDCSKPEDMAKYDLLAIPSFNLPAGHAFMLRKGSPIVMQSHYVNTGKTPIRIRDLLRFRRVDASKVKTWAAPFATNMAFFEIKPGQSGTLSYDCEVPKDYKLMMTGGHMHEWGKKYVLSYAATPADTMKDLNRVDEWMAHYRDEPPTLVKRESPMDLPKGTILRTECNWFNDTKDTLMFPHEMCSTFGVVVGSQDPWLCVGDK